MQDDNPRGTCLLWFLRTLGEARPSFPPPFWNSNRMSSWFASWFPAALSATSVVARNPVATRVQILVEDSK
ncbi:hypothetical protein ABZX51_006825 [Aspergillus tubingensis]